MTDRVFTEATIAMAAELIRQRNRLVDQLEEVSDLFGHVDKPKAGILSVSGKSLKVLVTREALAHLVQPVTDEIERLNEELHGLGVMTIDEETTDAPAQTD